MPNDLSSPAAFSFDWERLTSILDKVMKEQRAKLGKINIIVAGRTGVGKSTLVNAVFGEGFAKTAMGRPVTEHATWYERPDHPLRILDTMGLEIADYKETWQALKTEIAKGRSSPNPCEHIHIGWVCVQEPGLRFEEAEQKLVEALKSERIATVVVLTKHGMFPEFQAEVCKLAPMADAAVPVRALPMRGFPDAAGLEELVQITFRLLPKAVRDAFIAAQKIDLELKTRAARLAIVGASTAAAAAAAVPLPFSDAITIVPIQIGMIVAISLRFGIEGASSAAIQLASTIIGCVAATAAGRVIAGQLLKLAPGGSLVNAGVAGALTKALGESYLGFLLAFHEKMGRLPSVAEVAGGFDEFWTNWNRKGDGVGQGARTHLTR